VKEFAVWRAPLAFSTLLTLMVCLSRAASAEDYFISPTGLDTNDASSPAAAWLTFDHAVGHLQPGDRLLLADGHYTRATTGLPEINCSSPGGNANNGTPGAPITLAAQNERQAHLDTSSESDLLHRAFEMVNCSYWIIDGLHIQGTQGISIGAILTDNGTEFCGKEGHPYETYLELNDIEHRRTKVRTPQTNGFVERFNRTVLEEFFRVKFREKLYESVEALQEDLDEWLKFYNIERPHLGYRNNGRTPYETVLKFSQQSESKEG